MIIETGSQNASRTPGLYAYPVRRYNTSSVEQVSAVQGRNSSVKKNSNIQAETLHKNQPVSEKEAREFASYSPASISRNKSAYSPSNVRGLHVNMLV